MWEIERLTDIYDIAPSTINQFGFKMYFRLTQASKKAFLYNTTLQKIYYLFNAVVQSSVFTFQIAFIITSVFALPQFVRRSYLLYLTMPTTKKIVTDKEALKNPPKV